MTELEGFVLADRYFLRRKVGSGGMASVYDAWDRLRNTQMAVKTLRYDKEVNPERIEALTREAEWLRKLEHPYIVRLYEVTYLDGVVFLVMDWIDGMDLRQQIRLRGKPFSPEEILRILHPVCFALHYTHQQGVFHCDVKPANILLTQDGRVLLTDFGVAQLSEEGRTGGTPFYMAPEQILGQPVDARTDVYGLGITLYELLTGGALPYRGESQESQPVSDDRLERVKWEQANLPLPPVTLYNPEAPLPLVRVVERALQKDPAMRYATVLYFWKDLELACAEAIAYQRISQSLAPSQPVLAEGTLSPQKKLVAEKRETIQGLKRFMRLYLPWMLIAAVMVFSSFVIYRYNLHEWLNPSTTNPISLGDTPPLEGTSSESTSAPEEVPATPLPSLFPKAFACMGQIYEDAFIKEILGEVFIVLNSYDLFECKAESGEQHLVCYFTRRLSREEYAQQRVGEWLLIPTLRAESACRSFAYRSISGDKTYYPRWLEIRSYSP